MGSVALPRPAEVISQDLSPGDVILIKGRDLQRFEWVAFLLAGNSVRCDIDNCNVKVVNCEYCPRL